MNHIPIIILLLFLLLSSLLFAREVELKTVKQVDLNRYLGRWFQLAYYPNTFQPKNCPLTVAEYSLNPKGDIVVQNICYADTEMKSIQKQIRGKAFVMDKSNTKLKVQFFWPFKGDYWIIDLDEKDYSYAVVGEPKRKFLWILSRNYEMDQKTYEGILKRLQAKGYDPSKLKITGKLVRNP